MNTTAVTPDQVIGYDAIDSFGKKIGTIDSAWVDRDSGDLTFMGVKTTPLIGKLHIIPFSEAQIDSDGGTVTVPYSQDQIKDAPTADSGASFTREQESQINDYYDNLDQPTSQNMVGQTVAQTVPVTAARPAGNGDGFSPGDFPVDDLTYDLIALVDEKLKGLEAFDEYLQDADGDDTVTNLLTQLRQQDAQAVQALLQVLGPRISG